MIAAACGGSGTDATTNASDNVDRTVSSARPGLPELRVKTDDLAFDPRVIEMTLGQIVNIVLVNQGSEIHDFSIDAPGIHTHPEFPVYIPAAPGEEAAGELHAEVVGEFEIVCTVPGHEEAGHVGVLRVTG